MILEKAAISAKRVDVINVLARIVEKIPTFTETDEIVAAFAFIVESDILEKLATFANRVDV